MSKADLSYLDELVEEAMTRWQIPGLALAVVQNGAVIRQQGYGLRDLTSRLPVTIHTQFSLCSLTKSFTAAGLGLLVDERRLDWNTRIRDGLPDFRLHDETASEHVTVFDLLTHRSGLPRHDRIWSPPAARSRADMLEVMRYLPFSRAFRETHQYCNLGYIVAGAAIEQISGQSWETFMTDRLLQPLDFRHFNFSTQALEASDNHALPHPRDGASSYQGRLWPMHAAPAGGINASVSDMANWLGFLLSYGEANGTHLLSPGAIEQMMTPHIHVEESAFSEIGARHYGLGLTCEHYCGDRTVSHTGSLPGWGSMMSMMPEHGIGVVVLTNRDPCPVRDLIIYSVFDTLRSRAPINWLERFAQQRRTALEEEQAEQLKREALKADWQPPTHPPDAFVGRYAHPAYGELSVFEETGALGWKWRGVSGRLLSRDGTTFELQEHGEARFNPPLQVTFQFNADGAAHALTSPLEPTVAEMVFQRG